VSSSAPTVVLVLTTIAAEADGPAFARTLVDEQLAACVNVLPAMTSVYRWKGQVESDREQQIVIKTTRDRLAALEKRVKELHAYELPEFVVIAADEGSAAYLDWVAGSVTSAGGE
jgi:periplasmic divalent cation tolerance protein